MPEISVGASVPCVGQGGLGKGVILEQHLSTFINIDSQRFFVMLVVCQGPPMTVIALVLQVGLLGRIEGRRGCQCPHFHLRHLGRLVWSWGVGGGDGSSGFSLVMVFRLLDGVWKRGPFPSRA